MKRLLIATVALAILGVASLASAQEAPAPAETSTFSLLGGADLKSSYDFDDLYRATKGPVIQPWTEVNHNSSNCYLGLWGSAGLQESVGNEVDYTLGCRRKLSEDVSAEGFVAYYDIQNARSDIVAVSAKLKVHKWTFEAEYYGWEHNQDGKRVTVEYAQPIGKATLTGVALHERGLGLPPITVGGVRLSYPVWKSVTVNGQIVFPIIKDGLDNRKALASVGLSTSF